MNNSNFGMSVDGLRDSSGNNLGAHGAQVSPLYSKHVGRPASYQSPQGNVVGVYIGQDGDDFLEFNPSIIYPGPSGRMEICTECPTTIPAGGVMRPLGMSLDELVKENNDAVKEKEVAENKSQ